jgi:RNA polymerase sigma-32 factor
LVTEGGNQEVLLAENEERGHRRALLDAAMAELKARERHIITARHLRDAPLTLEKLSQHYGISRERVRQIEGRAFEKLRAAVSG